MRDLLDEIERAVRARGWSARQASMRAVGTPELIRDMRRGRVPSVERFRALCEVLDLEFYVGPPRSGSPVDTLRLERAVETAESVLAATGRKLTHSEKGRMVATVYDLIGEGSGRANAMRVIRLVDAATNARSRDSGIPRRRGGTRGLRESVRVLPWNENRGQDSGDPNPDGPASGPGSFRTARFDIIGALGSTPVSMKRAARRRAGIHQSAETRTEHPRRVA